MLSISFVFLRHRFYFCLFDVAQNVPAVTLAVHAESGTRQFTALMKYSATTRRLGPRKFLLGLCGSSFPAPHAFLSAPSADGRRSTSVYQKCRLLSMHQSSKCRLPRSWSEDTVNILKNHDFSAFRSMIENNNNNKKKDLDYVIYLSLCTFSIIFGDLNDPPTHTHTHISLEICPCLFQTVHWLQAYNQIKWWFAGGGRFFFKKQMPNDRHRLRFVCIRLQMTTDSVMNTICTVAFCSFLLSFLFFCAIFGPINVPPSYIYITF